MTLLRQSRKTLRTDARRVVEVCAGWNARTASRRITRFLDQRMKGSGLSIAQFGLMAEIAAASDDSLGALAERTGLDPSTLSRNLHNLETEGWIEIAIVERDLRKRVVWLTEKGARRLEAAMAHWRDAQEALARLIDPQTIREIAVGTADLDRS